MPASDAGARLRSPDFAVSGCIFERVAAEWSTGRGQMTFLTNPSLRMLTPRKTAAPNEGPVVARFNSNGFQTAFT